MGKLKAVNMTKLIEKDMRTRELILGAKRTDGWENLVTQIGTENDKRMASQVSWRNQSPEYYEQLYAGDEIASRICNVVPEEALRKGWEWTEIEQDLKKEINDRCEQLDLRGALERSWKWGRAFGGSCLHIVTDTDDPASPLAPGEKVLALRDLSRYDLRIMSTDVESDFGSPNWGNPYQYYLIVQMGSSFKGYPIHWTRMVRFDGYMVPRRTYIRNGYWHDSILNRLENAIRNYQTSNDAVATMLADFNVDIFKMKDLAALMGAGKEAVVKSRLEMVNYAKSVINCMILDADDEDYENKQKSIEGVAELLTKQANRLVAATDIPHTKLLGESPDGSNATGNSTTSQWFDHIESEQENYLRPKLQRLLTAIFNDIPQLGFKFKPLQQLTELEEAERRNKVAQTDQIYATIGALDPTEIADSRFGGETYSSETKLDVEAREAGLIGAGAPGNELYPEDDPESPSLKPDLSEEDEKPKPEKKSEPKKLPVKPEIQESNKDTDLNGSPFKFRNEVGPVPVSPKTQAMISQAMSEPMRDPKTDPKLKPGGRPNKPRTIEPEKGNGVTAPSGANGDK